MEQLAMLWRGKQVHLTQADARVQILTFFAGRRSGLIEALIPLNGSPVSLERLKKQVLEHSLGGGK